MFHGFFNFGLVEDGDFDAEVLTKEEDDFAAKAEQAVLSGEDKFFDF